MPISAEEREENKLRAQAYDEVFEKSKPWNIPDYIGAKVGDRSDNRRMQFWEWFRAEVERLIIQKKEEAAKAASSASPGKKGKGGPKMPVPVPMGATKVSPIKKKGTIDMSDRTIDYTDEGICHCAKCKAKRKSA